MIHNFDVITQLSVKMVIRDQKFLNCTNKYLKEMRIQTSILAVKRLVIVAIFAGAIAGTLLLAFPPASIFVAVMFVFDFVLTMQYFRARLMVVENENAYYIPDTRKHYKRMEMINKREGKTISQQIRKFFER